MRLRHGLAGLVLIAAGVVPPEAAQTGNLKDEITALHRDMVAAFKQDPASVARFYTDDATIMGGGSRAAGRDQIDAYWTGFSGREWSVEVLEVGGDSQSPWVRGRSTLGSPGGPRMVTEFIGILKRGADGRLRFYVDMYVRASGGPVRVPGDAP